MPVVSRGALYELVWSDAVRTVAERFGVSDVGLRKICAKADVPVPPRGYWTKLKAGKRPLRTRLRPREPGMPDATVAGNPPQRHRWPPMTWEDTDAEGLQSHLTPIVVRLIVSEEQIRQARAAAERHALEERVRAETARWKQLLAMARDLRSADEIRPLVNRVSDAKAGEPGVALWSAWAMGVADRLDPVLRLVLDERGATTLLPPDWPDLGAETFNE